MKWKAPSDRAAFWLLSPILIPIAVCAVPVFLPLAGLTWLERKWANYQAAKGWHEWFAWRPVKFNSWSDRNGEWVWLERIKRRHHGGWEYWPIDEEYMWECDA